MLLMPRIARYHAVAAILAAVGLFALGEVVFSRPTQAGGPVYTITVTSDDSDNNGNCTLREATEAAVSNMPVDMCPAGHPLGPDRIELSEEVYELSNNLFVAGGGPVEIIGVGAERSAIDGNDGDIVLVLSGTADVAMEHVAIINGHAIGSGGGIQQNGGTLELTDVLVADNTAGQAGGGVFNADGLLIVEDSIFTGNVAEGGSGGSGIFTGGDDGATSLADVTIDDNGGPTASSGGGITIGGGNLNIRRSTISNNETGQDAALNAGGGIFVSSGAMTLANSTVSGNVGRSGGGITFFNGTGTLTHVSIAGNTATLGADGIAGAEAAIVRNSIIANGGDNCAEPVISGGHNLEDADDCGLNAIGDLPNANPDLEPLADKGGPTLTHALGPDSQALSLVGALCVADDQRGVARPQGDGCDAGSFESGLSAPPTPSPSPTPPPMPTPTATPTGTPTGEPTPSGTPHSIDVPWGDNNCQDGVNPVDALIALRHDAGLQTETNHCPEMGQQVDVLTASQDFSAPWGDLDCNDSVDPVDALKILRFDAGLEVDQSADCPDPGQGAKVYT